MFGYFNLHYFLCSVCIEGLSLQFFFYFSNDRVMYGDVAVVDTDDTEASKTELQFIRFILTVHSDLFSVTPGPTAADQDAVLIAESLEETVAHGIKAAELFTLSF